MDEEKKVTKVTDILEEVIEEMCDKYCHFPSDPIPEGKDEDWLTTDENSPCYTCPLNKLL